MVTARFGRVTKAGALLTVSLAVGASFFGCGKEDDKKSGKSIGAPAVEPPVSRNVPDGLKGASLYVQDNGAVPAKTTAINAVKSLLKTGGDGPSFIYRLKMVDNRVSELDKRAQENPKACLADGVTPKAYDIGGTLPGSQNAGMLFQCQENITGNPAGISEAQLAFGLTSDTFYLMERTLRTGTNGIAVFAKTAMDGSGTEAWEIGTDGDNADFKHIKAKDGVGLEATIAGSSTTSGDAATCGLHVKSNGTLVYLKGSVSQGTQCSAEVIACLDAKTGADVDSAQCTTAKLNVFEMTSLTPALAQAAVASAKAIIAKKITGHIDFTADAEVAADK